MKEVWKDIDGFEGYQVSNKGNVRSRINNRYGLGEDYHLLKPVSTKLGYKSVQLGRRNRELIHRLVANAFIPNLENKPLVRHLDDDPSNNNVKNLAWGTQTDNMQDCVKHGRLVGNTKPAIEAKKRKVISTSLKTGKKLYFNSIREAADTLHVWPQHICHNIQGKISQTGGYTFEYNEEM